MRVQSWLYNRSGGSILVAGIAHAAGNTVFYFLPNLNWDIYQATALATALVLLFVDRMWRKLPAGHHAVSEGAGVEPGTTDNTIDSPVLDGM